LIPWKMSRHFLFQIEVLFSEESFPNCVPFELKTP
jgi:hypothetical protein